MKLQYFIVHKKVAKIFIRLAAAQVDGKSGTYVLPTSFPPCVERQQKPAVDTLFLAILLSPDCP